MIQFLLVAGWACTRESLGQLAEGLSSVGSVHVVSLHDMSGTEPEMQHDSLHTVSSYATGLTKYIRNLGRRCIIVGWSTGGMIALEASMLCPDLIRAFVFIGSTARFCIVPGYAMGKPVSVIRAMRQGMGRNPGKILTEFFQAVSHPLIMDQQLLRSRVNVAMQIGVKDLCKGLSYLQHADFRNHLQNIKLPSLVIHGDEDAIVPWQAGKYLADMLGNSEWFLHHGAGHDLPLRYPEQIYRIISEHLEGL